MKKNDDDFLDDFISLDHQEDSEFVDWYSIEGSVRISELSRQMRSFFNYKAAVIRFRFSRHEVANNPVKNDSISTWEAKLSSLFSQLVSRLKMIGVEGDSMAEKMLVPWEKIRLQPNSPKIVILKEIKSLGEEIWKIIHVLSELEIHDQPRLLNVIIQVIDTCCCAQSVFSPLFSEFYLELRENYLQLGNELSEIFRFDEKSQLNVKKKRERRVRIGE